VEPLRSLKSVGIAKMDASKARKYTLSGEYWLVPTVAKMDPVKVYLYSIGARFAIIAKMDSNTKN